MSHYQLTRSKMRIRVGSAIRECSIITPHSKPQFYAHIILIISVSIIAGLVLFVLLQVMNVDAMMQSIISRYAIR